MFSETRYTLNGDLRVAYRASPPGARDIVLVPNWFTTCEHFLELPSVQGWLEAMTTLGRLIFFDQPGTGASDPVEPGALPTLEQWADSITAVLDDLGSREAELVASNSAFATAALFAATHPSRTTALVGLEVYADPTAERTDGGLDPADFLADLVGIWGTGEIEHVQNPDMPWNEEIRASWARMERLALSPRTLTLMYPLATQVDVRAVLPTVRVQPSSTSTPTTRSSRASGARTSLTTYPVRSTSNCRDATCTTSWNRGASFQEIAEFLTGQQPDVADDRVLATVLFTDIVDSTRQFWRTRPHLWCQCTGISLPRISYAFLSIQ
jgi:pimeloyl-ACP methyl ester carboxylesterase